MAKPIFLKVTTVFTYADGRKESENHDMFRENLIKDLESMRNKGLHFKNTIYYLDGTIEGCELEVNKRNPASFQVTRVDFSSVRKEVTNG